MHTVPTLPGWHHAPTLDRGHAVGPILGHPTKPNVRFFMADGDGAGGAGGTVTGGTGSTGSTGSTGNAGDGSTGNEPTLSAADAKALREQADRRMQERNAARDEAKAFRDLGLTVEEIAELKAARDKANGGPTPEQIAEQARKDADKAAADRYAAKARASAVREQATVLGFHNPRAALAMLDADALAKIDVTDDEADGKAVAALLTELAKAEPYLVKAAGAQTAAARDAGIGSVGSSAKPDPGPGQARMRAAYESAASR